MRIGDRWRAFLRSKAGNRALLGFGWMLIVFAPLTAPLPGPGATLMFAAGLSLVLKSSPWARRAYVRGKGRYPRVGAWCDWGMRRASHKRRTARAKALAKAV